jgi:hypothetical protein
MCELTIYLDCSSVDHSCRAVEVDSQLELLNCLKAEASEKKTLSSDSYVH